jgi:SSS family solute:Na+ symporter
LAYLALGNIIIFFIGPPIWEYAKRHQLQTMGDFFERRYSNRFLTTIVALVGALVLVLYLQLQITGLGIIVNVASFERVSRASAMVAAAIITAVFVAASGVRGAAWVSILKDILLALVAVFAGFGLPHIRFGGVGPMFTQLLRDKPGFFTMPGGTTNLTHSWYITTVLANSLLICFPHYFAGMLTAKSADTVRRNAILMPFYLLPLGLIIFAGCAAIVISPGLKVGDLSLLTAIRTSMPPWVLGVVGGAGALTAMVPASVHVLTASTLLAKNVFRPYLGRNISDAALAALAKYIVVALFGLALAMALNSSVSLVGLLIVAYSGVAQFTPGIVLAVATRRTDSAAVLSGLLVGLLVAGILTFTGRDPYHGLNAGFVGLVANCLVVWIHSVFDRSTQVEGLPAVVD